jgi:hypothetical protein
MVNAYPEKPVLPYKKTTVAMCDVVDYLRTLNVSKAIKIAAFILFRTESGNGNKGVNNNYCGLQADSGRWPAELDKYIIGTCVKSENMTGKQRIFLCFESFHASVDFLINRIESRGLYVGGTTHLITKTFIATPEDWAKAYHHEWVTGSAKSVPSKEEITGILSMYRQGVTLFA